MTKQEELSSIFESIFNLNVCGEDKEKVRRNASKTNIDSKVMIIAEAMAFEQVRLSGINYFYKDGRIGNTGKALEKFLNKFHYSVYPNRKNCIYHTEIVHSFPGYVIKGNRKVIRRPSKKEIELSIESGVLQHEIDLIKPKLILLMGNTAYGSFYNSFLKIIPERTLSEEIEKISKDKGYKKYKCIPIIPIQHSSGANPRFSKMLENKDLISLIQWILSS